MNPVFAVSRLSKAFGGITVARDISLALAEGERLALIGPNGAGKTSFVEIATGRIAPDAGHVRLAGEEITTLSAVGRVRAGLVRSFQVTRLFPEMTPEEHVVMAVLQRLGRATRIFARFGGDPAARDEAAAILAELGLAEVARRRVGTIAYGQQRLTEIAIALAQRPKVLLLDEPAAGVPAADTPLIEAALARLPASLTVLMIEHDMDLVFRFARRVAVMAAGEIIFEGPPAEVARDRSVREAYLGSYAHAGRRA
ncbi:ABC transporter ATP-binding protein [Bosea sp. (in: a-proteobacteria)]|uniref:ABC transporter ATP-binding protein n=1 Tax=Bosea sp. (in: a-proteobacteria) TaxID=1871050 RepID=UPI0026146535|nr:ABC transporter ATP-binding protein [Bosea sp. (in: a-proteobacteria)]MCO5090022.1 ABC transporter ATP-binding protein [Bosea sp. (in: a-proteobacteria)]